MKSVSEEKNSEEKTVRPRPSRVRTRTRTTTRLAGAMLRDMRDARHRKLLRAHARLSQRPMGREHVENRPELHFPTCPAAAHPVYPERDAVSGWTFQNNSMTHVTSVAAFPTE